MMEMLLCTLALCTQTMAQTENDLNDSLCHTIGGREKRGTTTSTPMDNKAMSSWIAKLMSMSLKAGWINAAVSTVYSRHCSSRR